MKKIGVKLALLMTAIIVASSILSFFASMILSPNLPGEHRKNHEVIATSLRKLEQETALDLDSMIEVTDTSIYEVQVREGGKDGLSVETIERLDENEVVFSFEKGRIRGLKALVMIRGEVVEIRLNQGYSLLSFTAYRLWDSLLFFVAIGALLAMIITRRVVRPILRLSEGTQQVAGGDFDVEIDVNSEDEVGILTENFNRMVKELKNMEVLRKDFISNVSHEFKTPMASIKGFATLLKDPDLNREQRDEYVNIIVEETDRLAHLSSNLLKLSKLENQEIPDAPEEFSLDEQIRRTVLLLEPRWSGKGLDVQLNLEEHFLEGNEELLQQVWVNLVSNGIKFSKQGGTLKVNSREDEGGIMVEIIDEGIGMTPEVKARIFEKFYQGDSAHGGEGSGLGLPLAKRIIEYYRGSIDVESEPGQGTIIKVHLPERLSMDPGRERQRNA